MKKQQLKSEMREYRNRITIEEEGEKKTWRRSGPHSHSPKEETLLISLVSMPSYAAQPPCTIITCLLVLTP